MKSLYRFRLRILLLVLMIALASSTLSGAYADRPRYLSVDAPEAYVNAYYTKVYAEPNADSRVYEIVPFARCVKVLGKTGGWTKVYTVNRHTGYCKSSILSNTCLDNFIRTMYIMPDNVEVYKYPSVDSTVLYKYYHNDKVHCVSTTPKGEWVRVIQDGNYGYIQRHVLDDNKYEKGVEAWCATSSADIYYDSDNKNSKFASMSFGQKIRLISVNGEWAKIRGGGATGYCKYSNITKSDPNVVNTTVYTQVSGNILYLAPGDNIGKHHVDKNIRLELQAIDESNYWAKVLHEKKTYYVPSVLLDTVNRGDNYKKVVATSGLHIREGASTSTEIVKTVPKGTEFYLLGAVDGHAKVATIPDKNGKYAVGYVDLQYLA